MPRRTGVDGAAARLFEVLGHVRRHAHAAQLGDQLGVVVPLVAAQRDAPRAPQPVDHQQRRVFFGPAVRRRQLGVDDDAVAVLDQHMRRVTQLRFLALALLGQQGVGIRCRAMRLIAALVAVKVHCRVAPIVVRRIVPAPIFGAEALVRGPGFQQRAVHREVFVREQLLLAYLTDHRAEESLRDVAFQQPVAVLREHRMIPRRIIDPQPDEPAKQQVVLELLDQHALTADRVERLQQQRPQQMLGRDRRPAGRGVQPGELGGQVPKCGVDHRPDRPQGVVGRDPLLGRHVAEHRLRLPIVAAHAHLPLRAESGMRTPSVPRFSAPC